MAKKENDPKNNEQGITGAGIILFSSAAGGILGAAYGYHEGGVPKAILGYVEGSGAGGLLGMGYNILRDSSGDSDEETKK